MKLKSLFIVVLALVGIASAKESPAETEARYRAQVAEEKKDLEEARSKPAAEVMPKLVSSAADRGTTPAEIDLGFNRREVALSAIKKVAGYEKWFRERLRALLPPGMNEVEFDGGRLKFVAIPVEKRGETRSQQCAIFRVLERLATDEAIRVLADYLWDDRILYPPGDDYGSPTMAEDAASAMASIHRTRKFSGHPGYGRLAWQEWWTANKDSFSPQPK